MSDYITVRQFLASDGVDDWRVVGDGALAFFATTSFAESTRFASAIAELPGVEDHKPGIDIRDDGVTVRLVTASPDHYGVSQRDLDLARAISGVGRRLGLIADPGAIWGLLVIPGAPDIRAVMPFWQAILGYQPRPDSPAEDLVDPRGRGAPFWFEEMEQPRTDGGGAIHLAVWLPYEQAEARIEAALAAGGHMVRDEFAPSWWTLADAYGNEVDISTPKSRD